VGEGANVANENRGTGRGIHGRAVPFTRPDIANAVGSMGTALTQGQAELLKRFVDEVVIAYDQDAAGSAASLRGMQILRNVGLNVRVARLPAGEDPDGLVRKGGAEAMQEVLDAALPFHEFFIESLKARHDVTTIRGKERLLEDAREFSRAIRSEALYSEIVRQISDLTGLQSEFVRNELVRVPEPLLEGESPRLVAEHVTIEDDLLSLVLRGELPWEELSSLVNTEDFSEANRPIIDCLQKGLRDLTDILAELDEEGARRASFYILAPRPIKAETAIEEAIRWIAQLPAIERRLPDLDQQIRKCTEDEDWELWGELIREKAELRAAWLRAKDATRRGINEQQDKEERSEDEAS